jgi:anionic cell wall polymer biosynthesis LytR-Cps2A-Psr (LCP) family protein
MLYDPQKITAFQNQIESLLDITFSFYVVFDMENLVSVVDLLEGVDIMIDQPVAIYDTERPVLFPSGITRLDGDKSRLYLTYSTDVDTPDTLHRRKQRFFSGFLRRLSERNDFLKNEQVARYFRDLMTSDIDKRDRTAFFNAIAGLNFERLNIQTVGGEYGEISGQTLLLPSWDGSLIKEIVRQSSGALTRQTDAAGGGRSWTVEVLNGTAVAGLASRTADLLRSFGYDVITVSNAQSEDYVKTEVIDRSGQPDMAKAFADVIRCKNIRVEAEGAGPLGLGAPEENFEIKADFTLTLGRDFNGRYTTGN